MAEVPGREPLTGGSIDARRGTAGLRVDTVWLSLAGARSLGQALAVRLASGTRGPRPTNGPDSLYKEGRLPMSIQAGTDRRVAVVTGGSGAIGGAIAARLASDHTVVVLDRQGDIVVDLGDPVE